MSSVKIQKPPLENTEATSVNVSVRQGPTDSCPSVNIEGFAQREREREMKRRKEEQT